MAMSSTLMPGIRRWGEEECDVGCWVCGTYDCPVISLYRVNVFRGHLRIVKVVTKGSDWDEISLG